MNNPFDPKIDNTEIDKALRDALRPVDPGEDFTQSVLSQLPRQDAVVSKRRSPVVTRWLITAMAASIAAVVVITLQVRERHEREAGLRARQQVLEALQVTSEKLNVAYRVVHDQSRSRESSADDSGA